ncbi:MAG: hypothetical protein A2Y69_15035 [Candidatus Aminicenantes bacterium RBG_13_59_9]|nr:MAG: hypothetical protein A2Y69_15035 [Candidatus Aminicenantes bacterium RBG_13_59_9]
MRKTQANLRLIRIVRRIVMRHLSQGNSNEAGRLKKPARKRRYFHFSARPVNSGPAEKGRSFIEFRFSGSVVSREDL